MKIYTTKQNYTNNFKKNPSFGTQRLMNIDLQKILPNGSLKQIPAKVSLLTPEDLKDIKKILPTWLNKTNFGGDILINFIAKTEANIAKQTNNNLPNTFFLAVERTDKTKTIEKFRSLAMIEKSSNETFIDFIQSANKIPETEKIKGAGELLLYYIVKSAKEKNHKKISLISTADDWYEKLGWQIPDRTGTLNKIFDILPKELKDNDLREEKVFLRNTAFNKFLKYIEKKYKIEE